MSRYFKIEDQLCFVKSALPATDGLMRVKLVEAKQEHWAISVIVPKYWFESGSYFPKQVGVVGTSEVRVKMVRAKLQKRPCY